MRYERKYYERGVLVFKSNTAPAQRQPLTHVAWPRKDPRMFFMSCLERVD